MNPRQRRGALLMGVALIGALAVFFSVTGYVADVRSDIGDPHQVLALNRAVEAFEPIGPQHFDVVEIPSKFITFDALAADEIVNRVAAAELPEDTILQEGMIIDPPALGSDEQEIAVTVSAETGVAGQIGPGSRVDIYATFDGGAESGSPAGSDCSMLLISNARILLVGHTQLTSEDGSAEDPTARPTEEVVPVTFALPASLANRLVYAESFAAQVRLAKLNETPESLADSSGDPEPAEGGSGIISDPRPGVCNLPPGLRFSPGGA